MYYFIFRNLQIIIPNKMISANVEEMEAPYSLMNRLSGTHNAIEIFNLSR